MIGFFFQVCVFAGGFFLLSMFLPDFKIQNGSSYAKMGVITALIVDILCDVILMMGLIPTGKLLLFIFFFIFRTLLIYGSLMLCKKVISDFQMGSNKSGIIASISLSVISSLIGILFH